MRTKSVQEIKNKIDSLFLHVKWKKPLQNTEIMNMARFLLDFLNPNSVSRIGLTEEQLKTMDEISIQFKNWYEGD